MLPNDFVTVGGNNANRSRRKSRRRKHQQTKQSKTDTPSPVIIQTNETKINAMDINAHETTNNSTTRNLSTNTAISLTPTSIGIEPVYIDTDHIFIINEKVPTDITEENIAYCFECGSKHKLSACNGIRKYCHKPICYISKMNEIVPHQKYECDACIKEYELLKKPFIDAVVAFTYNLLDMCIIDIIDEFQPFVEYYHCFECKDKNTITICNGDYENGIDDNGYKCYWDTSKDGIKIYCAQCSVLSSTLFYRIHGDIKSFDETFCEGKYLNYNGYKRINDRKHIDNIIHANNYDDDDDNDNDEDTMQSKFNKKYEQQQSEHNNSNEIVIKNKVLPTKDNKEEIKICRVCWTVNEISSCNGIRKYCHTQICKTCKIREMGFHKKYECVPCRKEYELLMQPFINILLESSDNLFDMHIIQIIDGFLPFVQYYDCFGCKDKNIITICNADYKNGTDHNGYKSWCYQSKYGVEIYCSICIDDNSFVKYKYLKWLQQNGEKDKRRAKYLNYNGYKRTKKMIDYRYKKKQKVKIFDAKNKSTVIIYDNENEILCD